MTTGQFLATNKSQMIGTILSWRSNNIPDGWALCDGSLLQISGNEVLFSVLGATYGGDGFTTFALPKLCGQMPAIINAAVEVTSLAVTDDCSTDGFIIINLNDTSYNIDVIGNTISVAEVTNLTITDGCSADGQVTLTLNGSSYNIDVIGDVIPVAEVTNITVTEGCLIDGQVTVELNNTPYNIDVVGNVTAVAEVTDLIITAGCSIDGQVIITLNGIDYNIDILNGDTTDIVASKINSYINTLVDYTSTVNSNIVTITAVNARAESDAIFNGGSTGVTGSITVINQGIDQVIGDTITQVVSKINTFINTLSDYTSTISNDTIIITAVNARAEIDTTFNGNSTGVIGNIVVTTQGIDEVIGDTPEQIALKINTFVNTLIDYTAIVNSNIITITAINARAEIDATFNGNDTGITATVSVITQGVDEVIGDTVEQVASKINALINTLSDYTSTVNSNIVTITANNARSEEDATFNSNNTGVTTNIDIIQGSDQVITTDDNKIIYKIIATQGISPSMHL